MEEALCGAVGNLICVNKALEAGCIANNKRPFFNLFESELLSGEQKELLRVGETICNLIPHRFLIKPGKCKGLIAKMGGTISVTSEVGKGSVFTFTLPL